MSLPTHKPQLSLDGCRQRQERLRRRLSGLDAALVLDPRHIYYLSGYWRCGRVLTPAALLLETDGRTTLIAPSPGADAPAVNTIELYAADRIGTLIDDPYAELFRSLRDRLSAIRTLGVDGRFPASVLEAAEVHNISADLRALRRAKDPEEVAMLERGIAGCDAAYAHAKEILRKGVTEVTLYAGMLAAATEALDEPVTEFGNDFQCGALGSLPRPRPVEAGETAILDIGVVYRGYSSDLCRTFVVGGQPSEAQTAAYQRVLESLRYVEETVKPGVRCKAVYQEVHAMLDGFRSWTFPHHLGHGIGLSAHEAPRLNPYWDDVFEVGDVFTVEPGLYAPELRAGLRIEQDYFLTSAGLQRLSHFPTDLT